VPDALTVIQLTVGPAVQLQPALVVTLIVPLSPVAAAVMLDGVIVYVHGAPPWFTVNVWPAIVRVALLAAVVEFASAPNSALPLPLPLAPLRIPTHVTPLVAVHAHPAPAVIVTVPLPPAKPTNWLAGEIV
jgi:hypothetical protein